MERCPYTVMMAVAWSQQLLLSYPYPLLLPWNEKGVWEEGSGGIAFTLELSLVIIKGIAHIERIAFTLVTITRDPIVLNMGPRMECSVEAGPP